MESWKEPLHALALLVAVNAMPVVVAKLLHDRPAAPLDFGRILPDGQRLFGPNKTWRGLGVGVLAGVVVAWLLDESWRLGLAFALVSLAADALSSCIKRRMRLKPGQEFLVLDQLGEALLPLSIFARPLGLDLLGVLIAGAGFITVELATRPLRHLTWTGQKKDT